MLHDEIARRMLELDIFRALPQAMAEEVARAGERMVFRTGQTIIRAGEAGEAAYLLLAGDAVAEAEDEAAPQPVPEGALVGELAMLVEHTYGLTVTCRSPVRAVRFSRSCLLDEMARTPDLAEHLVERLGSRLTRIAVDLRRLDTVLALAGEPAALSAR